MAEPGAGTVIEGEVEERASRMGWVPQEDFRGSDDKWVTAEKFVERGENELPIMRERLRKMDGTVKTLNKTINSMNTTFGEFQEHQKGVSDRAYAKAVKDIEAKKLEAVERNDVEGYKAATKEQDDLKPDVVPVTAAVDPEMAESEATFEAWKDGNAWFNDDLRLQKYAVSISGAVQEQTGLAGKKLYDKVGEQVAAMYPERFDNVNRSAPQMVVGDSGNPPPPGKRNFAALPKEAQETCRKFIKEIPGYTKEQYVKDYEWE